MVEKEVENEEEDEEEKEDEREKKEEQEEEREEVEEEGSKKEDSQGLKIWQRVACRWESQVPNLASDANAGFGQCA